MNRFCINSIDCIGKIRLILIGVCVSVMIGWLIWVIYRMFYNVVDSYFFFFFDENLLSFMIKKNVYLIWYVLYYLICGMEFYVCFEFFEIIIFFLIFCKILIMCWLVFFFKIFFFVCFFLCDFINYMLKKVFWDYDSFVDVI